MGTKKDLKYGEQVIRRLALARKSPVTLEQGMELLQVPTHSCLTECATRDLIEVEAIDFVLLQE